VRFPAETVVAPKSVFVISGRKSVADGVDFGLLDAKDFLFKAPDRRIFGNFVVLLAKSGAKADGMYFAPNASLSFLPDRGFCITYDLDSIPYYVPDENDLFWKGRRVLLDRDPAICCFLFVGGNWIPSSRTTDQIPAVKFSEFNAGYHDGIVSISWKVDFEADAREYLVERKDQGGKFETLKAIPAKGDSKSVQEYEYYDAETAKGQTVVYRIVHRDIFGNEIPSAETEVLLDDQPEEFTLVVVGGETVGDRELSIRFSSLETCHVRIRLFDSNYRQMGILFDDRVMEGSQQLVRFPQNLQAGNYLVIADQPARRFYREFSVIE